MPKKKAWTKQKRSAAARKGVLTRQRRAEIIRQCRDECATQLTLLFPFATWLQHTIKLEQRVAKTVSLSKGAKSLFSVPKIVTGLMVAFQAGIRHYLHLNKLVSEVKLAEALGLPYFFGPTTASDLVKQAERRPVLEMGRLLRAIGLEPLADETDRDIDIVVDTTGHPSDSRKREQVAVGYCNGKKEPCLKSGRVVVNGRPVFVQVYPGNENPDEPFDKGLALARLLCRRFPERIVHLGMDTGFASQAHEQDLQQLARAYANFRYSMTVHVSHPKSNPYQTVAQAKAKAARRWKRINSRSRVVEMGRRWLYSDSAQPTRVVVVESKNPTPPPSAPKKAAQKRRRTKKRKNKKGRRPERYYLIATNYRQHELKAKALFKRHHQRPVVEFSIKDGKQSYRIQHLPHEKYWANCMFLNLVTLAQLLGILYNQLVLPDAVAGSLVATIREDVWRLPGQVIDARHLVLRGVYYRLKIIEHVCKAIKRHLGISVGFAQLNSS